MHSQFKPECDLFTKSILVALLLTSVARAAELNFSFAPTDAAINFTKISPETVYDAEKGFGYIYTDSSKAAGAKIFAVELDEGNYDVTIRFGDPDTVTSTTVKAESRRLMLEKVETAPGQYLTKTFTVNVRRPVIARGGSVSLAERERSSLNWDNRLTLEFLGKQPGVAALSIKPANDAITVYIAGDSTVTDQPDEPWGGWGQMLPRFFGPGVAVCNHAWSGLALNSFEHQRRLDKILSGMKPGDYLFIQFGHNDQKDKAPGAGPSTTYKTKLKTYIEKVRAKGGIPVVVASMERRRWENNVLQPTLADFAQAAREAGAEEKVPVIDLNAMSIQFYTALGQENSTKAFVFYPANTFPGQSKDLKDNTHHNNYGAYELARCVVQGIRNNIPALATHLAADAGNFDPSHPDVPEQIEIPASPFMNPMEKPAGN